ATRAPTIENLVLNKYMNEVPKKGGKGRGGVKPNNNVQRVLSAQGSLRQAEVRVITARTPQARQQAVAALRQASQRLSQAVASLRSGGGAAPAGYDYKTATTKVEFQASEKVKVRSLVLPETYDEKGEIKKYSAKELADLRGKDKSLPGYESSLEKLEVGQKVKVVLAAAAKKTGPGSEDKDEPADDKKAEKSKQARLIVILAEASSTPSPGPGGKGKKKP
ncbi:MAG: hypothetical protein K2W96_22440, partial [Gemmataceae bacterium]|nr:hypothetical protein [Gemmataceae bacterium]